MCGCGCGKRTLSGLALTTHLQLPQTDQASDLNPIKKFTTADVAKEVLQSVLWSPANRTATMAANRQGKMVCPHPHPSS